MVIRTLVVDDNEGLRVLLRVTLQDTHRYSIVGEAENGLDAIWMAGRLQPDLVMLDMKMPGMSGFEALPEIRRVSPGSMVVAFSMLKQPDIEQVVLGLGATAFLDKGLPSEDLIARLDALTRHHRSRSVPSVDRVGRDDSPAAVVLKRPFSHAGDPALENVA